MNPVRSILFALCLPGLAGVPAARAARTELMEYNITWVGVSVGTMSVHDETGDDGTLFRSIRIQSLPWVAAIYPVDNTIECTIQQTPKGPRHTIVKKMREKTFTQNDTLVLLPDEGRAIWNNAVSNTVHAFNVPTGAHDFVSFFFDLRDAAGGGALKASGDYQLIMDDDVSTLEIRTGPAESIQTPLGRVEAIPVQAISKSPALFSRNKPRNVWVSATKPVVIFADVQTRFGSVRGTLARWEIDGQPVAWAEPAPSKRKPAAR